MNNNNLNELLAQVINITKEAGRKIIEIYQSDFSINFKDDRSPLTAADLASHNYLSAELNKLTPHYPIISEESDNILFAERANWENFWLIDPLDGTKEFIKRNGEFTVNVALINQHRPILGVVYAPAKNLCYFAAEGVGAFKQLSAMPPEKIVVQSTAASPLRAIASRSHSGEELLNYLNQFGDFVLIVSGSSLKFCLVADGSADIYPRIAPTSEWDTAAAHCIVCQAGGEVTNFEGQPLRYNTKPSMLNPYFIVFGDQSRDWTRFK